VNTHSVSGSLSLWGHQGARAYHQARPGRCRCPARLPANGPRSSRLAGIVHGMDYANRLFLRFHCDRSFFTDVHSQGRKRVPICSADREKLHGRWNSPRPHRPSARAAFSEVGELSCGRCPQFESPGTASSATRNGFLIRCGAELPRKRQPSDRRSASNSSACPNYGLMAGGDYPCPNRHGMAPVKCPLASSASPDLLIGDELAQPRAQ
jgi:hypothetical protein